MQSRFGVDVVVVAGLVLAGFAGCSSTTTGANPAAALACVQKATADGNTDCAGQLGRSRKLDCASATDHDQAIAAGCVAQKPGDVDVCCPTTVNGTAPSSSSSSPATVLCAQKASADTDPHCSAFPGKPRHLDCDPSQTNGALTAGCELDAPDSPDVCCPTTVAGQLSTSTSPSAKAQATVDVALSGTATGCSGTIFTAGSFSTSTPLVDGASDGSGTAAIICSVRVSGASFAVAGTVTLGDGSSFQVAGDLNATAPAGTVTGILQDSLGTFTRTNCTAIYPTGGGVSAGRVWATLTCNPTGTTTAPDACTITTRLKLENCTQ